MVKMNEFEEEFIIYVFITLGFFLMMYLRGDNYHLKMIKHDFTNPFFLGALVVVSTLGYLGLSNEDPDVKRSTHHAITATIASYFSHLSIVFPEFFFVGFATLYSIEKFG